MHFYQINLVLESRVDFLKKRERELSASGSGGRRGSALYLMHRPIYNLYNCCITDFTSVWLP